MSKTILVLTALLLSLAAPAQAAELGTPPEPAEETSSITYWLRNREGWFWYRDPPIPARKRKPTPTTDARPPELVAFEDMQKRLEELKRIAVMNPTDANLLAYMRYQRMVMNKSEHFAERWQRLVWTTPELDYGLTGRPTNATAINLFDETERERQAQTIKQLAATHALLFIFRSDCPYCHRFAPILKRFEQDFGMTVFAVSLDGRGLPEYPHPQSDNGIAARLDAGVVPALYLTAPAKREIQPVGFGLMALNELIERIAVLAPKARPEPL